MTDLLVKSISLSLPRLRGHLQANGDQPRNAVALIFLVLNSEDRRRGKRIPTTTTPRLPNRQDPKPRATRLLEFCMFFS